MDPRRFDDLTRSLSAPRTRRGALATLAGLAALASGRAGATHKPGKPGHRCTPSKNHLCPPDHTCVEGKCVPNEVSPTVCPRGCFLEGDTCMRCPKPDVYLAQFGANGVTCHCRYGRVDGKADPRCTLTNAGGGHQRVDPVSCGG